MKRAKKAADCKDKPEIGTEHLDTALAVPRKSRLGMRHEVHSDSVRIDLIYDLMLHELEPIDLMNIYEMNYNTIRNMKSLYLQQEGETYKHCRMYADINNIVLRVAIENDPELIK